VARSDAPGAASDARERSSASSSPKAITGCSPIARLRSSAAGGAGQGASSSRREAVRWLDRLIGRAVGARPGQRIEPVEADPIERAFDCSGYVRETAVRELGRHPRPEAIRVLLMRANDRADQTRSTMTAMPWPTPMHIVQSAYLPPLLCS
jgi:hypothetical protein